MASQGNHDITVNFRSGDMEARFRSIEQGILSTGRNADRLQQQFNRTSQTTDNYGRSAQRAARSTADNASAMGRSAREAGNLTNNITRLTGATTAQDRAQASLASGLSRIQSLIGPLVGAFLSLSVVISGLTGSIRIFTEFQATMSSVRAVSQGTASDMLRLTEVAKDLGATTMFSATQAAQGMQLLGQAGFNAAQIIDTMPGLLDLAASGEIDLASAADIAASTLKGFALSADQATRVADDLALAAASTNTSVGGLGEGMKYVAPVAASLGISLEDTTAALGTLADAGFQGTMAGTGLRRVLGDLINPTKEARDEFARLKLDLNELNPTTTRLIDIVDKLAKSNLDAASANKIFGEQGGPVILSLMAQSTSLRDLTAKMQDAGGSAAEMAAIMRDNLKGEADELSGAIETVRIALGTGMEPALRAATIQLTEFFQGQEGAAEEFGRTLGGMVATAVDLFLKLADSAAFLKTAFEVLIAVQILIWIPALIASLLKAIATFQAWVAANAAAGTATAGMAGTIASLGATVTTVSPILNQYGTQMVTVTTETTAATAAQSRFLTAGITPLGLALGLVAGGLLYVANSYKEMADEGQAAIEDMIDANNRFMKSIQDLKDEASDLNSIFDKSEEFMYQLRAKGIKDPTSPEALQVRERIEAQFNERDTAVLRRHTEQLAKTREEMEGYKEALIAARNAEKNFRFASPQEEERARALERSARGQGYLPSDVQVRGLDAARETIAKASKGLAEANATANTLEGTIEELNERTNAYVAPARAAHAATVLLGGGLSDTEKKAQKALEAFQKLSAELEASRDANRDIAAAYGDSTAAGIRAEMQADENARANQAAASVEEQYRDAIRARVREQVQSEREATGSKTIASLTDQLKAAEKLRDALASGNAPAIEEAKRAQDLLGQTIANTTGAADKQADTIKDLTASLADINQQNAFTEKTAELRTTNDALGEMAKTWDGTTISIERANAVLQINNQITQATIGHTTDEAAAIARLIAERERLAAVFEARMTLGKQEEELRRLKELSAIKRSDYRTELAYAKALRATNTEHEVRSALLTLESRRMVAIEALKKEGLSSDEFKVRRATVEADFDAMAQRTETAIRGAADLNEQIERQDRALLTTSQEWLRFADALDNSLSGVSDQFQEIASGLAVVIRGFVDAAEAGDNMQAKLAGLATVAQGLYAIADAAGLLDQNVTQGGFGGRGEGNYTAEGSMVGAIVGGIIGYFAGGNVQAGMAIGSAAGGILGSFIKKGADEALGQLELDSGDIVAAVVKNEASLGGVIRELGNRLDDALKDLLDVLGATIEGIPLISVKVRDGIISVWVGNVNTRVKEMGDAITFAVTEILKQSKLTGLSDVMRKVLENTDAIDLDQLAKDLEFGQWYERLGLRDAAVMLLDQMAEFRSKFRQAIELGLDTAPVAEWLGRQFEMMRNQILGIQESPEEALRKNAEAFNQQIKLLEADQLARRANLLMQKAELQAKIALARAEMGLTEAEIQVRIKTFNVESEIVRGEVTLLGGLIQALIAVDEALAMVDTILGSLPDLISDEEVQKALKALRHSGGGGGAANELESFGDSLRDIVRSALPDAVQAVMELGDKLRDLQKRSRELAEEEERIRKQRRELDKEKDKPGKEDDRKRNRQRERLDEREDENARLQEDAKIAGQILIDAAKEAIRDPVREFLTPDQGGTAGLSQWETRRAEIAKTFDDARAANEALIKETGQSAIEFWQLNEAEIRAVAALAEEVIDSLGSPLEQTRDRMKELGDAIGELRKDLADGVISAERFDQAISELGQAAASEMFGLAADLLEQMGLSEQAAQARRAAEEIDFHIKRIQLTILFESYVALRAIADDLKIRLGGLIEIINDPANWPDFSAAPATNITSSSSSTTTTSQTEPDWVKAAKDALAQATEWSKAALGPLAKSAADMIQRRDELMAAMTASGISGTVNLPGVGYVNPFEKLSEAYAIQVRAFVDETIAGFESVPDVISQARELKARLDDMAEALASLGVNAEDAARAEAARQNAITGFVDESLQEFERLGRNPLALELQDMTEHFANLATAFQDLGVGADGMARLEATRIAALDDFWKRATEGIRTLAEELTASHPRTTAEGGFLAAQAEFRDLQAKAASGDLDALEKLAGAASTYEQLAKAYTGGGVGMNEILDEIIGGLNGIADALPEDILGSQLTQLTTLAEVTQQSLAVQQETLAFFRSGGSIVFNPETAKAAVSSLASGAPSSATPTRGSTPAPTPSSASSTAGATSGSSYAAQPSGAGTPTGAPPEVVCVFADGVNFDSSAIVESVERASRDRREEHAASTKLEAEMLAVEMSGRDGIRELVAEVAALRREMRGKQARPAGQAN